MAQNYKDTLLLPKTDFPMKASLTAREPEILKTWEETRLYQQIQKAREGAEVERYALSSAHREMR